jgi:hypothetical protein
MLQDGDSDLIASVFFVILVAATAFFLLNAALAIVTETFEDAMGDDGKEEEQLDQNADYYKPNIQFKSYQSIFDNLTKSKKVETKYPILSCIISYDSTRAILITKKDDREVWIRMFSLATYEKTFDEQIGGKENSFIRCKEVE